MTVLATVFLTALLCIPASVHSQQLRQFSPLRDDLAVAQAVFPDSLPVVRNVPVNDRISSTLPESPQPTYSDEAHQTPAGALYRSLAVAGWGQWKNGRRTKALLFFTAEAICIGGYFYENTQYTSGDYTGPDKDAIRTDRNTFLLYWMIAKVFGIMDAYVDAQFNSYDIEDITPGDLVR